MSVVPTRDVGQVAGSISFSHPPSFSSLRLRHQSCPKLFQIASSRLCTCTAQLASAQRRLVNRAVLLERISTAACVIRVLHQYLHCIVTGSLCSISTLEHHAQFLRPTESGSSLVFPLLRGGKSWVPSRQITARRSSERVSVDRRARRSVSGHSSSPNKDETDRVAEQDSSMFRQCSSARIVCGGLRTAGQRQSKRRVLAAKSRAAESLVTCVNDAAAAVW